MYRFLIFLFIPIFFLITHLGVYSDNIIVSPVRYEIQMDPGDSITRTAIVTNNTSETMDIITWKEDFTPSEQDGIPQFGGAQNANTSMRGWISFNEESFTLAPGESREVSIYITAPSDASPGGHYASVFFSKDIGINPQSSNIIYVRVQYGILLLVNVTGEVVEELVLNDIAVQNTVSSQGYGPGSVTSSQSDSNDIDSQSTDDNTQDSSSSLTNNGSNGDVDGAWTKFEQFLDGIGDTVGDVVDSIDDIGLEIICSADGIIPERYKGEYEERYNQKCVSRDSDTQQENQIGISGTGGIGQEDFDIEFEIPFVNQGNTHVKPKGKITLIDEDGNQLKRVGKEVLIDDDGTITGEKIVDYIPINNLGGNILPGTSRQFLSNWEGFTYKGFDEEGNEEIKYLTPSQYFTLRNQQERPFIMFWETVQERVNTKKIKAVFDIEYEKLSGEVVNFNAAKEFDISYKERYVGWNMKVVHGALFITLFVLFWSIISRLRTQVCYHCKRRVKKKLQVCKYCNKKPKPLKRSSPGEKKKVVKSKKK